MTSRRPSARGPTRARCATSSWPPAPRPRATRVVPHGLEIGGLPLVKLRAADAPAEGPAFLEATVAPGRGMMLLQARLRLPSGEVADALAAPAPEAAAA